MIRSSRLYWIRVYAKKIIYLWANPDFDMYELWIDKFQNSPFAIGKTKRVMVANFTKWVNKHEAHRAPA